MRLHWQDDHHVVIFGAGHHVFTLFTLYFESGLLIDIISKGVHMINASGMMSSMSWSTSVHLRDSKLSVVVSVSITSSPISSILILIVDCITDWRIEFSTYVRMSFVFLLLDLISDEYTSSSSNSFTMTLTLSLVIWSSALT